METEGSASIDTAGGGEGPYLRRARALLAERADLLPARPPRSVRLAGSGGPSQQRSDSPARHASRQLTLPLPRDRKRRRLRMVG